MIPGMGRPPGEGNGNPLQYSCLGKFYGQRSLVGYSPWGCKESDTPEPTPTTTTTPPAHVSTRIGRSNLLVNSLMHPERSFPEAGDQYALTVALWQEVTELCVHLYFSRPPRGTMLLPSFSLCLWPKQLVPAPHGCLDCLCVPHVLGVPRGWCHSAHSSTPTLPPSASTCDVTTDPEREMLFLDSTSPLEQMVQQLGKGSYDLQK